ncbi:glycosyltransferase family 2 protein [uncultured Elizabethkingia sp.]|uniref:glycosyltransferase family 2 protein n=1 Tax=uncultured Elizabethkingia sp. TaxID=432638 RepID=UPI002598FB9F|nr:glycosyltransferase family 2 protein [uncultured Elizabethkingia sp.]
MVIKPLVSVIIPVYNVQDYIEKCVRSLFEQTYSNIEYIFVDDCGQDRSMEILNTLIKSYPEREPQIKVLVHSKNKGLPAARNTGVNASSGEYICNCDSDDWIALDMVESLVNIAEEKRADIVFCDLYNVFNDEITVYHQNKKETYVEYLKDFFAGYSQGSVCNKIFKRKLFTDNQIEFPEGLPMLEDLRTIVQLYYYANRIEYLPVPLYYYVKTRTSSISGDNYQKSKGVSLDRIENVNGIQNFLNEKNITSIDLELGLLKLGAKQNLLINADSIEVFKQWRNIFPEANQYVKKSHLPLYYKIVAESILKNFWIIPHLWILLKKMKNSI